MMQAGTESDPRSDEDLVAAANEGDASAFEALYYRYRDWVVRLAYRFTGDRDDALDVLQDTFLYLVRKFPGFRLRAKMTTFLYPVVRNRSLAVRRKKGRYVSDEEAVRSATADETGRSDSPRALLAAMVASLPEAHREVLLMRFADEMSLEEIAAALRIPMGTVKSRLHNALEALRQDDRTRRYFDR